MLVGWQGGQTTTDYCIWFLSSKLFFDVLPFVLVETVMTKSTSSEGIILMHDFQRHTAEALPTLLSRLKAGGYKVVQMKARCRCIFTAGRDW
jgi:hypothetical protein